MKTIDKISKYGNIIFAAVLYTMFTMAIGLVVGDYTTKHYQHERLEMKLFYGLQCFDEKDIDYIIEGTYEFID